jgi:hypothetical protein
MVLSMLLSQRCTGHEDPCNFAPPPPHTHTRAHTKPVGRKGKWSWWPVFLPRRDVLNCTWKRIRTLPHLVLFKCYNSVFISPTAIPPPFFLGGGGVHCLFNYWSASFYCHFLQLSPILFSVFHYVNFFPFPVIACFPHLPSSSLLYSLLCP